MAIVSKIDIYELPEQPVLSIRTMIHFDDYPKVARQSYEKIEEHTKQNGLLLSGGPVCLLP